MIKEGIIIMEDGTEKKIEKCDALHCVGVKVTERKITGYKTEVQNILAINDMSIWEFADSLGKNTADALFKMAERKRESTEIVANVFLEAFSKKASEYL